MISATSVLGCTFAAAALNPRVGRVRIRLAEEQHHPLTDRILAPAAGASPVHEALHAQVRRRLDADERALALEVEGLGLQRRDPAVDDDVALQREFEQLVRRVREARARAGEAEQAQHEDTQSGEPSIVALAIHATRRSGISVGSPQSSLGAPPRVVHLPSTRGSCDGDRFHQIRSACKVTAPIWSSTTPWIQIRHWLINGSRARRCRSHHPVQVSAWILRRPGCAQNATWIARRAVDRLTPEAGSTFAPSPFHRAPRRGFPPTSAACDRPAAWDQPARSGCARLA